MILTNFCAFALCAFPHNRHSSKLVDEPVQVGSTNAQLFAAATLLPSDCNALTIMRRFTPLLRLPALIRLRRFRPATRAASSPAQTPARALKCLSTTSRSIKFSSSRTLPGQLYSSNTSTSAGSSSGVGCPYFAPTSQRNAPPESECHPDARATAANKRHNVQPEEQILPKSPLRHFLLEVAIRGRDQTDIDRQRLRSADAFKLTLLQHAQQLHLNCRTQIADLVEKQCAAIRQLETTLVRLRRRSKRALLVTKQLRLDQRFRQRRTTHRHEWSTARGLS